MKESNLGKLFKGKEEKRDDAEEAANKCLVHITYQSLKYEQNI